MESLAVENDTTFDSEGYLPYDDVPAAEIPSDAIPPSATPEEGGSTLANRIGNTKVYLISEAAATASSRAAKRKRDEEENKEETLEDMEEDAQDPSLRGNAILFNGSPISHLPTSNLFAYATHFDAHPIALEWIDDITCILVFSTRLSARTAYRYLSKSPTEEPSEEGEITAKPIPVALWPPEERINKSLGKGEGLKGPIRMRWAKVADVKKKGAKKESQFYKKYGNSAGKDDSDHNGGRAQKRQKELSEEEKRAALDDDLDAFLAEDDEETQEPQVPSKMRSDYIGKERKSLLERTSALRSHPNTLASRITAALPRRESDGSGRSWDETKGHGSRRRRSRERRPRATQEDLDAELDAFLSSKD